MKKAIVAGLLFASFLMVGCNKNQGGSGNKPSSPQGSEPVSPESAPSTPAESGEPERDPIQIGEDDFYSSLSHDPDVYAVISVAGSGKLDYVTEGAAEMGMLPEDIDMHSSKEATFTWDAGEGEFVTDEDGESFSYFPDYYSQEKRYQTTMEGAEIKFFDYDEEHFFISVLARAEASEMSITRTYTHSIEIWFSKASMWVERVIDTESERFFNSQGTLATTNHVEEYNFLYTYEEVE